MVKPADFEQARRHMVETQIERRGVSDPAILDAMRTVPREAFAPEHKAQHAYDDRPLPIGEGQTISQPFIVARMLEAAEVSPQDRVLEIGAGSGYAAAVLSRIAAHVCAMEWYSSLAERAAAVLRELGYDNVDLRAGDGSKGWPEDKRFDVIIVSAAAASIPETLTHQLEIGGRLVAPVGRQGGYQILTKFVRQDEDVFKTEKLEAVAFVPLLSENG